MSGLRVEGLYPIEDFGQSGCHRRCMLEGMSFKPAKYV